MVVNCGEVEGSAAVLASKLHVELVLILRKGLEYRDLDEDNI